MQHFAPTPPPWNTHPVACRKVSRVRDTDTRGHWELSQHAARPEPAAVSHSPSLRDSIPSFSDAVWASDYAKAGEEKSEGQGHIQHQTSAEHHRVPAGRRLVLARLPPGQPHPRPHLHPSPNQHNKPAPRQIKPAPRLRQPPEAPVPSSGERHDYRGSEGAGRQRSSWTDRMSDERFSGNLFSASSGNSGGNPTWWKTPGSARRLDL